MIVVGHLDVNVPIRTVHRPMIASSMTNIALNNLVDSAVGISGGNIVSRSLSWVRPPVPLIDVVKGIIVTSAAASMTSIATPLGFALVSTTRRRSALLVLLSLLATV